MTNYWRFCDEPFTAGALGMGIVCGGAIGGFPTVCRSRSDGRVTCEIAFSTDEYFFS